MQGVEDKSSLTQFDSLRMPRFGVQKPAVLLQRSCARGSNRPTQSLPEASTIFQHSNSLAALRFLLPLQVRIELETQGIRAYFEVYAWQSRFRDMNRATLFDIFMGIDITVL